MNKYLKIISLSVALTSAAYLPNVNAASSTEMLITIAESNPALVERLNEVALNDVAQLKQLLKMAESKPKQLERLLNLAETDPEAFSQLVTISSAETTEGKGTVLSNGTIDDGGVIRT